MLDSLLGSAQFTQGPGLLCCWLLLARLDFAQFTQGTVVQPNLLKELWLLRRMLCYSFLNPHNLGPMVRVRNVSSSQPQT